MKLLSGNVNYSVPELSDKLGMSVRTIYRYIDTFKAAGFAVAKRIQAPPVLSLTKRAFGYDHREAQLTPYFSREYHLLKKELLAHD